MAAPAQPPVAPPVATRDLVESNGRHTATLRVPAAWDAWKYDDQHDSTNRFYKDKVLRATAVSAVDFVAFDVQARALVMVECKDIRGATIENLPRLAPQLEPPANPAAAKAIGAFKNSIQQHALPLKIERAKPYLPVEFARNVRDTLVGLLGAARTKDPALQGFAAHAIAGRSLVCVLSFEMDPLPAWQRDEGSRLLSRLKVAIERELDFLHSVEVVICSRLNRVQSPPYQWQIVVSP